MRKAMARSVIVALLAAAAVLGVAMVAVSSPKQSPVDMESAILPPRAFRRWFYQKTHVKTGAKEEIPLDRFAGRGRGRRTAAKVPGYLDEEAKQVRQQHMYCGPLA